MGRLMAAVAAAAAAELVAVVVLFVVLAFPVEAAGAPPGGRIGPPKARTLVDGIMAGGLTGAATILLGLAGVVSGLASIALCPRLVSDLRKSPGPGTEERLARMAAYERSRLFSKIASGFGLLALLSGVLGTGAGLVEVFNQIASYSGTVSGADLADGVAMALTNILLGAFFALAVFVLAFAGSLFRAVAFHFLDNRKTGS